ncbi:MAG: hypothetical protein WCT05_06370, partial [Lentisphaeria bacterium]
MIDDLQKKGIIVGEGKAFRCGRAAQFIHRIPIGGVGQSCVITIGYYRVVHYYAKSSGFLDALEGAFGNNAEALFALDGPATGFKSRLLSCAGLGRGQS